MIVGNLAELSKSSNAVDLMKEKSLSKIDSILNCGEAGGAPRDLQRRVRSYFSLYYQQRSSQDLSKFILQLPGELRDDLAAQMHWVDGEKENHNVFGVLHKIPFFVGLDSVTLIHICAKMNVVQQQPVSAVTETISFYSSRLFVRCASVYPLDRRDVTDRRLISAAARGGGVREWRDIPHAIHYGGGTGWARDVPTSVRSSCNASAACCDSSRWYGRAAS